MKVRSSARAKALAISQKTKQSVYERDGGCCIICGRQGLPEAHYIPRSRGGLGIEENIVTLCRPCHMAYDQCDWEDHERIGDIIEEYLAKLYPGWNPERLVYKKYEGWR